MGFRRVQFTGGEPLLRLDIADFVRNDIKRMSYRFSVRGLKVRYVFEKVGQLATPIIVGFGVFLCKPFDLLPFHIVFNAFLQVSNFFRSRFLEITGFFQLLGWVFMQISDQGLIAFFRPRRASFQLRR